MNNPYPELKLKGKIISMGTNEYSGKPEITFMQESGNEIKINVTEEYIKAIIDKDGFSPIELYEETELIFFFYY